jgi:hypothetical protein
LAAVEHRTLWRRYDVMSCATQHEQAALPLSSWVTSCCQVVRKNSVQPDILSTFWLSVRPHLRPHGCEFRHAKNNFDVGQRWHGSMNGSLCPGLLVPTLYVITPKGGRWRHRHARYRLSQSRCLASVLHHMESSITAPATATRVDKLSMGLTPYQSIVLSIVSINFLDSFCSYVLRATIARHDTKP